MGFTYTYTFIYFIYSYVHLCISLSIYLRYGLGIYTCMHTHMPMHKYTHASGQPTYEYRSSAASDFDSAAEHVQSALDSIRLSFYLNIPVRIYVYTWMHTYISKRFIWHTSIVWTHIHIYVCLKDLDSAAEYVQSALDSVQFTYMYMCACAHACIHKLTYIGWTHTSIYLCLYVYSYVYMYVYIYTSG